MAHEGLQNIENLIGNKRRLILERDDILILLNNTDPLTPPQAENLSQSAREQMDGFDNGSCIVAYKEEKLKLRFVGWKGTRSLRAYVDINDAVHMLRLLGADISKFEKNKFVEKMEKAKLEDAEEEMDDQELEQEMKTE